MGASAFQRLIQSSMHPKRKVGGCFAAFDCWPSGLISRSVPCLLPLLLVISPVFGPFGTGSVEIQILIFGS